jgi:uncharacterized membrane protein SirB2
MAASTDNRLLSRLARLNPTTVFLAGIAYVLVAMFAPGIVGGGMLLVLAIALGALAATTWPVQPPRTRVVRLAVIALLVIAALSKIF